MKMSSPARTESPLARVTAVVVNYNSGRWLERCVLALRGDDKAPPAVEVIDNGSDDGSLEHLPDLPGVRARRSPRNLGFARGVNLAARAVELGMADRIGTLESVLKSRETGQISGGRSRSLAVAQLETRQRSAKRS